MKIVKNLIRFILSWFLTFSLLIFLGAFLFINIDIIPNYYIVLIIVLPLLAGFAACLLKVRKTNNQIENNQETKSSTDDRYVTILDAVKASKTPIVTFKSTIKYAQEALLPNEFVLFAMTANISAVPVLDQIRIKPFELKNKEPGVVVVTNRRILFCNSVLGNTSYKEIPIAKIQSIDGKSFIGFHSLRICGNTDMFVIDGESKALESLRSAINGQISSAT